ncbi:MAG: hypothetical protein ACRC33_26100, partial [Gemmataceae bacterium]
VVDAMHPSQLDGLTVLLDGRPLALARTPAPQGYRFTAAVPGPRTAGATHRVEIQVPATVRPCDRAAGSADRRPLGVAVARLRLESRPASLWGRLWGAA